MTEDRIIKFKVWDAKNKEVYVPEGTIEFDSGVPFFADVEDLIPLQFTGLVDKEGKEIYEGDVVKVDGYKNKGFHAKVIFFDGNFRVMTIGFMRDLHDYSETKCVVVGNVYENPELLKGVLE